MLTQQQAEELIAKYGSQRKAAEAEGISRKQLANALRDTDKPKGKAPLPTMSMNEIVHAYDVVASVIAILKQIPLGEIATDDELRRAVGVGSERWRKVRRNSRLEPYHTTPPGGTSYLWGNPSDIETLNSEFRELI